MNCPACGNVVAVGQQGCAVCAGVVVPSTEGNLAPKLDLIRELPALRRRDRDKEREKNWKDEVSERVQRRRKSRSATRGELPLFRDLEEPAASVSAPPVQRPEPVEARVERLGPAGNTPTDDLDDLPLRPLEELFEVPAPVSTALDASQDLAESGSGRFELGSSEAVAPVPVTLGDEAPRRTPRAVPRFALGEPADETEEPPLPAAPALEPAGAFERLSAAAVDGVVLAALASIVLYFTSRLTRVGLPGLWPTWPWLGGYLVLVALSYATYFTGTTGQTPGKMLTGIRVVDGEGRPPSYLRAFLRAALAGLGTAALGAGLLPLLLDARSGAFHDRITGTRVLKS